MGSSDSIVCEILQLTNTEGVMRQVAGTVIKKSAETLRRALPGVSDEQLRTIDEEVKELMVEHFEGTEELTALLSPVYQKHFTEEELIGLRDFYASPLGRKLTESTHALYTETIASLQYWAQSKLTPAVNQLLDKRISSIKGRP